MSIHSENKFSNPSDILDNYIRQFEASNGSGGKKQSKTKKSSKSKYSYQSHTAKTIHSIGKLKNLDLETTLFSEPVYQQPSNNQHLKVTQAYSKHQSLFQNISCNPAKSNPVEQVERLIGGLSCKIRAYKTEMNSIQKNTDEESFNSFKTTATHSDLSQFKSKSRGLLDSLQSFKETSESYTNSSSVLSFKQNSTTGDEFKKVDRTVLEEDEKILGEIIENEDDKGDDPLLQCLNRFQDLNKKLEIAKQFETNKQLETQVIPSFSSPSAVINDVRLGREEEGRDRAVIFRNISSNSRRSTIDGYQTRSSNSECFVNSTNRCVQNFINECIKITNEIPIFTKKINHFN